MNGRGEVAEGAGCRGDRHPPKGGDVVGWQAPRTMDSNAQKSLGASTARRHMDALGLPALGEGPVMGGGFTGQDGFLADGQHRSEVPGLQGVGRRRHRVDATLKPPVLAPGHPVVEGRRRHARLDGLLAREDTGPPPGQGSEATICVEAHSSSVALHS